MIHDDLWAVLYAPGFFFLRLDGEARWLSAPDRGAFRRTLGGSEKLGSQLQLGPVPRYDWAREAVADAAVLWVRTESTAEVEALSSWLPKPTFIFREGDTVRHVALWALTGQLDPRWTQRLNKRLAHAIGTAKKWANPANFFFTPPGSLTEGKKVVKVVHSEPTFFSARELVKGLPDAPDPRAAWRRRQAA